MYKGSLHAACTVRGASGVDKNAHTEQVQIKIHFSIPSRLVLGIKSLRAESPGYALEIDLIFIGIHSRGEANYFERQM